MEFSPESRERIYCGYVNRDHDLGPKRSISTIILISNPELFNISIKTTFNVDSAGGYALSLTICR